MEKYTTLGELLYVGFVYEKGRCKSSGIWRRSYRKSLLKHIELLYKIAVCMTSDLSLEETNSILINVLTQIVNDPVLKLHYPITDHSISLLEKHERIISYVEKNNEYSNIGKLIVQLLEDLLVELRRKFDKDKKRVSILIMSLHNLPRAYIDTNYETLCNLKMSGTSPSEAIEYAKLSMDSDTKIRYQQFF